jgi:hypothetical protein
VRRKPGTFPNQDPHSHAVRVAWWASFLATIALVALLSFVRSAQAADLPVLAEPLSGQASPLEAAAEESDANGEEEVEGEGCEAEDEGECEEEARSGQASEACLVKSASARVTVLEARDEVRLALRYTASSPALVSVEYGLRGGRGTLKMAGARSRFSRDGVFRDTETLGRPAMAKVNAATEFEVRLHAVNTPRSCHRLLDRDLTARHASSSGPVWTGWT